MLEFDIDSMYLTDEGETDLIEAIGEVWLNDECGVEEPVALVPKAKAPGDTSDGYHTFDELYEHRTALLMATCNLVKVLVETLLGIGGVPEFVFKSRLHHDGGSYEGYFIVGINCLAEPGATCLGHKWATWHCRDEWWDLFAIPELDRAPEWDGHTPADALVRVVRAFSPDAG